MMVNTLIDTVYVDQLTNGEQWNVLGTYDFSGTARVVINSQGGCTTSADAVKVGSTLGLTYTYSGWMDSNSYTTNFTDAGTHTVTVTVNDGEDQDSQDVTITVNNVNGPPLLGSIANITKNEGETITISPTATDPDGDDLTYTYSGWMTSNSYTTNFTDAGTHKVTVTVSDDEEGHQDSQVVTITVDDVNQPPVLGFIADITKNEGETITISPTATDPDFTSDQVTLEWDPNPESEPVDGYKIYYGTSSRVYDSEREVGNKTSDTIQGLEEGQKYYIAVKAYDTLGKFSDFSAEVVYTVPTLDLTYTYSGWMTSNSYTTNYTDAGTHKVTVTVSDGEDQDSQDVTVRGIK